MTLRSPSLPASLQQVYAKLEETVGPLHKEMREGAVRHPYLDHRPVVVPQELRRAVSKKELFGHEFKAIKLKRFRL
jgi:hypothetical protein